MYHGGDNVSCRHSDASVPRSGRRLPDAGVDDRQHHSLSDEPHHHPHSRQDLPETSTEFHTMGSACLLIIIIF